MPDLAESSQRVLAKNFPNNKMLLGAQDHRNAPWWKLW